MTESTFIAVDIPNHIGIYSGVVARRSTARGTTGRDTARDRLPGKVIGMARRMGPRESLLRMAGGAGRCGAVADKVAASGQRRTIETIRVGVTMTGGAVAEMLLVDTGPAVHVSSPNWDMAGAARSSRGSPGNIYGSIIRHQMGVVSVAA